jgi:hypothetical protein
MRLPRFRDPVVWRIAGEFAWRTFLIGLALFAMPPLAVAPTTDQLILAFIGVVIWCYYDGAFARGSWPRAMLEGGIWFFWGAKWTQVLLFIAGTIEHA